MKLFCGLSPSYSNLFFQNQATFSMKNFLNYGYDNSFAFMADGWHFENLPTNRNCLNFRALSEQVFLNSDLSGVRLLADADTARLDSFLRNTKLLRKQSKIRIFN